PVLRHVLTHAWDPALRARLVALGQQGGHLTLDDVGELDVAIGRGFADATLALLDAAGADVGGIVAIGSHGQTLRHRPHGLLPFTLQLGCGATIAERTGITTVSGFRARDVAAGGQGAPLVPALHAALLRDPSETRAVFNMGGIANLTLWRAEGLVRGFDTGPANALMDAWCLRHRGEAYDRGGAFAAAGRVDAGLLDRLLDDPWF